MTPDDIHTAAQPYQHHVPNQHVQILPIHLNKYSMYLLRQKSIKKVKVKLTDFNFNFCFVNLLIIVLFIFLLTVSKAAFCPKKLLALLKIMAILGECYNL
jgi:hypothetical protein